MRNRAAISLGWLNAIPNQLSDAANDSGKLFNHKLVVFRFSSNQLSHLAMLAEIGLVRLWNRNQNRHFSGNTTPDQTGEHGKVFFGAFQKNRKHRLVTKMARRPLIPADGDFHSEGFQIFYSLADCFGICRRHGNLPLIGMLANSAHPQKTGVALTVKQTAKPPRDQIFAMRVKTSDNIKLRIGIVSTGHPVFPATPYLNLLSKPYPQAALYGESEKVREVSVLAKQPERFISEPRIAVNHAVQIR